MKNIIHHTSKTTTIIIILFCLRLTGISSAKDEVSCAYCTRMTFTNVRCFRTWRPLFILAMHRIGSWRRNTVGILNTWWRPNSCWPSYQRNTMAHRRWYACPPQKLFFLISKLICFFFVLVIVEPAINVPTEFSNPQYLPDPRDGSLYELGDMGGLKKLPYTIPQLVASAPCRSSDGILYSGKKSDTWFLIDPKTGKREKVMGKKIVINKKKRFY